MGGKCDTHQSLFSSKFLILSACVQQTLNYLCFVLRTKGTSVRLSTLSFIICLHFFSPESCFSIGCAALETPKPICGGVGKLRSHECSPKSYCQALLGGQIIPLREIRHCDFFFAVPFSSKALAASHLTCMCTCP